MCICAFRQDSLFDNKTLKTLKVANNSLNSSACFTICVGIEENYTIREVVLDDNPIGLNGAKALLEVPTQVGNRVKVLANRCNILLHDSSFKFDRQDPTGYRQLDLGVPFERAIAFKMLQILATHSSYELAMLRYDPPAAASRSKAGSASSASSADRKERVVRGDIKLVRSFASTKVQYMDKAQLRVMEALKRVARAAKDLSLAAKLFGEYDADGSVSLHICP